MITPRSFVLISSDPVSQQRGSGEIFAKFQELLKKYYLEQEVAINQIGDVGRHDALPIVIVYPEATIYGPVTPDKVETIVEEHLYKGRVVDSLVASSKELTGKIAWLSARKGTLPAEQRIVLRRAGRIDPTSLEDYIVNDGYQSIAKVLAEMTPQGVIDELKKSNLRGRGGAGFPTATKWGFVAKEPKGKKYVVCNADESEPGTFKDRLILEGDPHSIIEAMLIAGYAVGADAGYIYIRGEYTLALQRLQNAIAQAKEIGMLGEDILGSSFNFELHLHSGAGAYICGEETALLESIEGNRGQPRTRPPFPTTSGLWGKPTLINNVETLANVPPILLFGADWFKKFGTPSSPGTKVYTILGNVNVTGLIEVPMGITLREVIAFYAQGMKLGHTFKMAQTGGSSGSIIPSSLQDTPMDFDSFSKVGVSLGSGALLICDEEVCVVDLAKVLLQFFRNESCGKCFPCRIGTQRSYEILEEIAQGRGTEQSLKDLLTLADHMYGLSNCGLGQTAGTPLKDILNYFRAEVDAHVKLGVCPAGVCEMTVPVLV